VAATGSAAVSEARAILGSPSGIAALGYLAAIAGAELVTSLADARLGVLIHTFILVALLLQAAFVADGALRELSLALALAPLIRILSLSLPLEDVSITYWYAVVAVPLLMGTAVVARTLNLNRQALGLSLGSMPTQLLVGCTGFAFGFIEYLILKPDPLIDSFSWGAVWVPALILLVGTGFTEEIVFRGVMQSAAREALGGATIVYVSAVFAVLHIGYQSVLDVAFVFAVALFFAWVVMRTRSILGVTLSHSITNVALFLIVPFLW
jgi:hypothetical protein